MARQANSNMKNLTVVANYQTDLSLVLNWLRLNKSITSSGPQYETAGGKYAARVKSKKSKKDLKNFVKDRFGTFATVK